MDESSALVTEILDLVRARVGVDFSEYRSSTVSRRIEARISAAGASSAAEYLERLRRDASEMDRLVERLTIKVSRFYRDAAAVDAVRGALAARAPAMGRPIRAWSAGCGRGEEAYTLAILLAESVGPDGAFEVVGTDVDPSALAAARAAAYPAEALTEVPPAVLSRSFEGPDEKGLYRVAPGLRARVKLARGDLAAPAPFRGPLFDLVACRNALIYFKPALQARVLLRLCAMLAPRGLLWLGEAEWPSAECARRLDVLDRRARLFTLKPGGGIDA